VLRLFGGMPSVVIMLLILAILTEWIKSTSNDSKQSVRWDAPIENKDDRLSRKVDREHTEWPVNHWYRYLKLLLGYMLAIN
jgi:hypothetical protein